MAKQYLHAKNINNEGKRCERATAIARGRNVISLHWSAVQDLVHSVPVAQKTSEVSLPSDQEKSPKDG